MSTVTLLPPAEIQFLDGNGNPLPGGLVYMYVPGTTTDKVTWQDSGQLVPNSNPIVLDSDGRALIWGEGLYRQVLQDSSGKTIYDQLTQGQLASSSGTWIPADLSSGGLAPFENVSVAYQQIGGMVFAYGTLTYPSTTDTNHASFSLPVESANANYSQVPSILETNLGGAFVLLGRVIAGEAGVQILRADTDAAMTNAALSTMRINFIFSYPATGF